MDKLMKKMKDMDPKEREKLRKLLKEKDDDSDRTKEDKVEQDDKKIDWMYNQDCPDQEEYLLGRRVDKYVEGNEEKEEDKDAPGALFTEEFLAKRVDQDMQVKMREDPLFMIRRQEEEARKKLLMNPIKMKQLQKIVDEQKSKGKQKKKKSKHKKKHKKHSDSSDSDADIINQYLAIVTKKKKDKNIDNKCSSSEHEQRPQTSAHHHSRYSPPQRGKHNHNTQQAGTYEHTRDDYHCAKSRDYQRESTDDRLKGAEYNSNKERESRHRPKSKRKEPEFPKKDYKSRERSPKRSRSPHQRDSSRRRTSPERTRGRSPKRKLTQEEMERRRAEMVENAQWRDEQRERNVKRYKEESDREEEMMKKQKLTDTADFVKPMMAAHANQSSVEDRIKRNIYNIQRTKADLNKNFHKR